MDRQTISFHLDTQKKEALDAVAAVLGRDRSYILNEAIDAYLEVQKWQMEHIQEGVRQADAGEFARDSDIKAAFARRRRRSL